jgi:hypothetical protein
MSRASRTWRCAGSTYSLAVALTGSETSESAAEWLGAQLLYAYVLFKGAEIKGLETLHESGMWTPCRSLLILP